MNSSPFNINPISNQQKVFGTPNNALSQSKPFSLEISNQNPGFGANNSPFNTTTQNSLFGGSSNPPGMFGSTSNTSFGNNVGSGGSNNSIVDNKPVNSIFNTHNTASSHNTGFALNSPQPGLNIGNQSSSGSSNFAFGTVGTASTNVSAQSKSLFGIDTTTNKQTFGTPTANNTLTTMFSTPTNTNAVGVSNIGGFSQLGSNFSNTGLNNFSFPTATTTSLTTTTNSVVSQSGLPSFGTGLSSNQSSNAFSFSNPQQNSVISSNLVGTTQSSFGFQSATPLQSSISNTGPVVSQNTFAFGTPTAASTSNLLITSASAPISNVCVPNTNLSTGLSLNPTSFISNSLTNKTTTSPANFSLNLSMSSTSAISQTGFNVTTSGLGGVSSNKLQMNNASPLVSSSVSAKKGLGGSPISDSSKSIASKDAAHKISIVKQVKDTDLLPELNETVENFKQFVTEQKKLKEEITKSNEVTNLMTRVEEESQILRQSISDVANGLQKIQVQSNKLKSDICKEQSNIKIAQTSSELSINLALDRNETSSYFGNKVRELENRAGLYLQEIEAVESMCNSSNKSTLTTRDLVEIIRKMDDEFIGLAAQLYVVHERVKVAKTECLRRYKQANNHQNPFLAIEGRFGDSFESISELNDFKKPNSTKNSALKFSDNIGSSPFDNNCYINQLNSFAIPKTAVNNAQKPNIFGINNNNPSINSSAVTAPAVPFSFSTTNSSFTLNKPPTNLFLNDTVSNKKRR